MDNLEQVNSQTKKSEYVSMFVSFIIGALVVTIFSLLFRSFGYNIIQVSGNSMYPTYKDKQLLLLRDTQPKDKDIIIFHPSNQWRKAAHDNSSHDYFIKRIVASGGDTLTLNKHILYVNNKPFRSIKRYKDIDDFKITIPKNKYFVMGDNYYYSNDSLYMYKTYHHGYLVDKSHVKLTAKGSELQTND